LLHKNTSQPLLDTAKQFVRVGDTVSVGHGDICHLWTAEPLFEILRKNYNTRDHNVAISPCMFILFDT
jgi:hypothetical protein